MKYREFGNTGVKISVLGFGCMRLPVLQDGDICRVDNDKVIPMIKRAFELGINYFDCAWNYCRQDCQRAVGKAIKPFRDKVYLSTKLPLWYINKPEEFWQYLMCALEQLDTTYIDFYHLHALNKDLWSKVLKFGFLDKLKRAKDMGLIRHICFSFHDDPSLMNEIVDSGVFETLLCQYNLIDRVNEQSMAYAKSRGMGIAVMGSLGGGNIVAGGQALLDKFGSEAKTAQELGFRFVLGNPNVCIALSGMTCIEELEENVVIADAACSVSNEEWEALKKTNDKLSEVSNLYCTGCGYCEVCPVEIKPATIFRAYNNMHVWELDSSAEKSINNLGDGKYAGARPEKCIKCGKCARMCPQKIDIPNELARTWGELTARLNVPEFISNKI